MIIKKLAYDAKQLFYRQFQYYLPFNIWYDLFKFKFAHNWNLRYEPFNLQVFSCENQILRKKTFGFKKKMK